MKMFEGISFESERLKTSKLTEEDAETLFQFYSDREAMKFRGSKPILNLEEAFTMIAEQMHSENQIAKLRLGIRNKSNQQLIGTLLLIKDENLKSQCEIGFSFGKKYWNKGYGKETLKMIEQKFQILKNIEIIKAWCVKENTASNQIFKKAGFSKIEQSDYPQSNLFIKRLT